MDNAKAERFAKLGLSASTVGTILLYFIGDQYYSGFLATYGVAPSDVKVDFRDALRINLPSLLLLYHIIVAYVGSAHQLRQRSPERDAESTTSGRLERWLRALLLVASLAALAYFFSSGHSFQAITILLGIALGTALAFVLRFAPPDLKLVYTAIAVMLVLMHARYAGRKSAPDHLQGVAVTTEHGDDIAVYGRIYESSDGMYLLHDMGDHKTLLFLPKSQIVKWWTLRSGYESE